MAQQQEGPAGARRRPEQRPDGALPPHDDPEAVSPPLRWVRRFTPLGIGRRRVVVRMSGGRLQIVKTTLLGDERVVAEGLAGEFHSAAASRGGRGLHLWHGDRLFRLTARSTAAGDGSSDVSSLGDDPISAVIGVVLLPFLLFSALGSHARAVDSERENGSRTLRWLTPVLGPPPPGLEVRPPLPGGWLTLGRCLARLAVLGGVVDGVVLALR